MGLDLYIQSTMASAIALMDDYRTDDEHQQAQAVASEGHDNNNPSSSANTNAVDPGKIQNSMKARKRTKTGCLSKLKIIESCSVPMADLQ